MNDPYATLKTVHLNYRYASAWQEVNARIAQRQNALNIFVTLATGIVTILLASANSSTPLDPQMFSLLLPLVSLSFGLLNYKHDKTIALLRHYLSACEQLGDLNLEGYNRSPRFTRHAIAARRLHDISCAVLIVFFNVVGIVSAKKAYPSAFTFTGWPIAVYLASIVVSLLLVLRSTVWPHKFE